MRSDGQSARRQTNMEMLQTQVTWQVAAGVTEAFPIIEIELLSTSAAEWPEGRASTAHRVQRLENEKEVPEARGPHAPESAAETVRTLCECLESLNEDQPQQYEVHTRGKTWEKNRKI